MHRALGLVLVLSVLVVACGGDDESCESPAVTTVSALIGPNGGTVELPGGGKVEIPKDALDETVTVEISEVSDPKPLPLGMDPAGKAYAFKPHGTTFAMAVTISVPFVDDDANEVSAMKLDDDADESWQTAATTAKTGDKLTIETTGFSVYMAVRPRLNSGVIVLPDGAILLPGLDASVALEDAMVAVDAALGSDAAAIDAAVSSDAAMDAAQDAATGSDAMTGSDAGCGMTDAGCPAGVMTQLVAGASHVCALYSAGVVYCWGTGASSGRGMQPSVVAPGRVQLYTGVDLEDAIAISANSRGNHTCALRSGGAVVCWGDNAYGQCGSDAPMGSALRAYVVPDVTGAVSVSAGTSHSCAVLATGAAHCWGNNASGQLSTGSTTPSQSASALPMVELVVSTGGQQPIADGVEVIAGQNHTCIVHAGRTRVSCAGSNSTGGGHQGMLGRGAIGAGVYPTAAEALLPANTTVASIHIGSGFYASHTCVLAPPSRPICWGTNTYLQLTTTGGSVAVPTQLDAYYTSPADVALGSDFSCVSYVHTNFGARVACQGTNGSGQLGDSMTGVFSDSVPDDVGASMDRAMYLNGAAVELMAAGMDFVCIKLVTGGVSCWGANNSEVFGDNSAARTFADTSMLVPSLP